MLTYFDKGLSKIREAIHRSLRIVEQGCNKIKLVIYNTNHQ
jgi:hypothetical protein